MERTNHFETDVSSEINFPWNLFSYFLLLNMEQLMEMLSWERKEKGKGLLQLQSPGPSQSESSFESYWLRWLHKARVPAELVCGESQPALVRYEPCGSHHGRTGFSFGICEKWLEKCFIFHSTYWYRTDAVANQTKHMRININGRKLSGKWQHHGLLWQ